MIGKHLKYLICLLISINGIHVFSQNIQVAAMMDTNKIRIGEQSKIDLYITHKTNQKKLKIQWPLIGDTLRKEIEVVNISAIDTTIPDKNRPDEVREHQSITITSTDSGFWAIDPFLFVINNDTAKPLATEALLLEVYNVPVDTSEASIRDIKTTLDEPFDWREYLPYVYWGLGALAVVVIISFIMYKYGKKSTVVVKEIKPTEPPHITALASLEEIRRKKLWQEGKFKEYHTLISDTLRMYIEGRYGVSAMELTSEEIFTIMNGQVIDLVSKEKLRQILTLADFVKFAKVIPIDVENELSIANAFDFVNGTKREQLAGHEQLAENRRQNIQPLNE